MSETAIDFTHQDVNVVNISDDPEWHYSDMMIGDLLVGGHISSLFMTYHMWRAADLRRLAFSHHIRTTNNDSTATMMEKLDAHMCGTVRLLREELQLLHEPGSYVGEVVKAMGKNKVLVKVQPEGKYSTRQYYPIETSSY